MKALEFESRMTEGDRIPVPPHVARNVPVGAEVRVILLWDVDEEEGWRRLTAERFAAAYAPEDEVYELWK